MQSPVASIHTGKPPRSRRARWAAAAVALATAALWAASAPAQQTYEIDWITFTNINTSTGQAFKKHFVDEVARRSNGRIEFNFRGGQDTVAVFDQGEAVKNGVVDLAHPPVGFYEAQVPGVGSAILTEISLEEERKPGGAFDYLVEVHQRNGMMYLGRAYAALEFFYLGCNAQPRTRQDFSELRIGTATATQAAVGGWGATVVSLSVPEYYPSMERGLVDCVASTPLTIYAHVGVGEVTDYIIDHGYFANSQAAIMNLQTWRELPADLQELIMEVMTEYEKLVQNEIYEKDLAVERRILTEKMGVEFYELDPETAQWFTETARDATWELQAERYPEVTRKLRQLLAP